MKQISKSFIKLTEKDKRILIKLFVVKILIFTLLLLVRPPTMIVDAQMYYDLTVNPAETFKPPGTDITKYTRIKPPGWALFLYVFYSFYQNWLFWAVFFNFIFSFLAVYLLYKITNEKIMWLFFFYPFFLYHSYFPLETPIFCLLIILSFYYFRKNKFIANFICNISSFFRIEGVLFSLYLLCKKIELKNLILFMVISSAALYFYGIAWVLLYQYLISTKPMLLYQSLRHIIPFLIPLFVDYKEFFTKHFRKIMILWFVLGLTIGYFKVFYEWGVLS
ncbi:MAG: hypothetical protein NC926_07665 [Candidatus Omnitrophica bacterium]|nr:hypothetical protein [Candidatus Omnitrophota bacterium]